jgi:hypothetical protein
MYGTNRIYYGSNNDAENYRHEHREKDRRVRRYIPGRELGKIWNLPGIL